MEWTDITKKVKRGLPVLDREFLESYYDYYTTRRIAPFKAQNVEYILNNSWETILKDQLHKVVTKYKFHRSLESRFFMDVASMMIVAEVAERVKPYRREKISINQGSLHYKMNSMFSVLVWTFYSVNVHMIEGPYGWPDRKDHPKLFVQITNDCHGGTYRLELDKFTEELYERLDAVCLSENVRLDRWLDRFSRQSRQSIAQGIKPADIKSATCKWIDWRTTKRQA